MASLPPYKSDGTLHGKNSVVSKLQTGKCIKVASTKLLLYKII